MLSTKNSNSVVLIMEQRFTDEDIAFFYYIMNEFTEEEFSIHIDK